ncbi:MAG: DUF6179 domain-containing protein [Oscillospiraceae bacterium]|nr:DUF6179 domain-containing protein [Oscillospiraceae bacterium]
MNEPGRPLPFLPPQPPVSEESALQAILWQLLAQKASLYTIGESSSIPVETARELLSSLTFSLELWRREHGLSFAELAAILPENLMGEADALTAQKARLGGALLRTARLGRPRLESVALAETLDSMGSGLRQYDCRFFAHRIPGSIDYPLCLAVEEELDGILYFRAH